MRYTYLMGNPPDCAFRSFPIGWWKKWLEGLVPSRLLTGLVDRRLGRRDRCAGLGVLLRCRRGAWAPSERMSSIFLVHDVLFLLGALANQKYHYFCLPAWCPQIFFLF